MSDNPHIRDNHSDLQTLTSQALTRHGEFAASTIQGDVSMMFIEFANMVLEEVRAHPLAEGTPLAEIKDYVSINEARPVPDEIIKAGLIFYYMVQQGDARAQFQQGVYTRTMNQRLWRLVNGNTKIRMRPVDGGSNKERATRTSAINGLPLPHSSSS